MYSTVRLAAFFAILFLNSCSPMLVRFPTVADEKLQRYVSDIGLEIVAVSEHHDKSRDYQFRLADFARRDILGLSIGKQRIFISYELTRLAYQSSKYRWLLRHTLAHEIAHDVLGREQATVGDVDNPSLGLANRITGVDLGLPARMTFRPYSRSAELAADRKGMEYWQKLGWDCGQWVRLFLDFTEQGYQGDVDHPTKERLDQALEICSEQSRLTASPH